MTADRNEHQGFGGYRPPLQATCAGSRSPNALHLVSIRIFTRMLRSRSVDAVDFDKAVSLAVILASKDCGITAHGHSRDESRFSVVCWRDTGVPDFGRI